MPYYKIFSNTLKDEYSMIEHFDMMDKTVPKYPKFPLVGPIVNKLTLPRYKIANSYNISDYISCVPSASNFSILSNRVIEALDNLKIAPYQILDISFLYKKTIYTNTHKALYFEFREEYVNRINYKESRFYKRVWDKEIVNYRVLEEYRVDNWGELLDLRSKIEADNYDLGDMVKLIETDWYDLFNFHTAYFPTGLICSENFKEFVLENGFTGFWFEPL